MMPFNCIKGSHLIHKRRRVENLPTVMMYIMFIVTIIMRVSSNVLVLVFVRFMLTVFLGLLLVVRFLTMVFLFINIFLIMIVLVFMFGVLLVLSGLLEDILMRIMKVDVVMLFVVLFMAFIKILVRSLKGMLVAIF